MGWLGGYGGSVYITKTTYCVVRQGEWEISHDKGKLNQGSVLATTEEKTKATRFM